MRCRTFAGLSLITLLAACGEKPMPAWHQEAGYRWRDLNVGGGSAGFSAVDGVKTGVSFQNAASEKILLGNRVLGQGAGVALGDVDGDGLVDVFLAKTEGCSALYRNLGGWKFEEITTAAGVGACDRRSTGTAFADVDGDRDLDLILLTTTGPNAIFLNDGKGKFTETNDTGLDATGRGATTLTMADVDGSGRLSLYVANYKPYNVDDTIPPQRRAFNQMVKEVGPKKFEIVPEHRRDYKLVMRPDMGGLRMTQRGAPDDFYLSDGKGHFTRVEIAAGRFRGADGKPLAEAAESFTLGARFVDLNGDGAPDLYVANDFEDNDELWFNDGKGNFRPADWSSQRQQSNSTMGVDFADVNGDGLLDIFAVDMLANDSHRLKTQIPTNTPLPKKPGDDALKLQQQRNTLFLNRGDGTFAEVSEYAGVHASGWSWGTMFMDVDLDGWQDILVANGHLWDVMDADIQEGLQNKLNDVEWQKLRWQFPPLKQKNVAFRNRGNLTFEDASAKWKFGTEDDISHALASADLDGDGDLDVVVNRMGAPALMLKNDASAARVAVRLVGDAPNTQAVGAKIRLIGGAVRMQEREVAVGGLYMSHSDYEASFAMGKSDSALIEVVWRDGRRSVIRGIRPNRLYEISTATAAPSAGEAGKQPTLTLFADVTAQLGGHTHVEDVFDDWDRQFLLPNGLSQLGPGVAWFDVDRDGAEDLVIGSGKGGKLSVFKNRSGKLVPERGPAVAANADLTGILGMTENGVTRLLAGVATWQERSDSVMMAQPAVVSVAIARGVVAATGEAAVGSHASSTGPIALGDYDGDGALDLFVGSRAIPMQYPVAASSALFRNVGGKFVYDTANSKLLNKVGLISASLFADINGDGFADLVLAREWNSVLLLLNDGKGRFTPAPDSWGLKKYLSRWNGVSTGDLDGDGRLDLVVTSWGRNTAMQADSIRPLFLYHGAIGARNEEEMLFAQQDARLAGVAPLTSYARARVAIPSIVNNVPSFAQYADAKIEKVLGPQLNLTDQLKATTFDHMVFLNRGDRFEASSLPMEAQLAPAFYSGVADFDGDGFDDVFLGQNFSQTVVGVPRFDGGRSLLLLGDGKGGMAALDGAKSGLMVYGDQRGAAYADFNGDARLDLVVSQNGGLTRLFENRGAVQGLRVRVAGAAANPDGVGVQLRVVYEGEKMGPVREVQAGAGYWSQNGAVQVLGLASRATAVWARWPGGAVTKTPVPMGAREVVVKR